MKEIIKEIIGAFVGAGGFSLILGLRANKVIFAATGGGLCWGICCLVENLVTDEIILGALIAAAVGTAYSEIIARAVKTPVTGILTPSLIPMVPGGSLYYMMASLISSERAAAFGYAVATAKWAVGIAAGVTVVTVLARPKGFIRPAHRKQTD